MEPDVRTTHVLLLRHAQTTAPNIWHGAESDVGLSEHGHKQARRLATALVHAAPVVVVTSGMRRAIETARPIADACGVPFQVEPELRERRIGSLCGRPFEGQELWEETLRHWKDGDTSFAPPGAESFDDMRQRILPVWHRLAQQHAGGTYVVVTHGGVVRTLVLSLERGVGDWNEFHCQNLALHDLVHISGEWRFRGIHHLSTSIGT